MSHHLRVQLTLLPTEAGGRKGAILPGYFRTVLVNSRRHFSALLCILNTMSPGGATVYCEVTLLEPDYAKPFFPLGTPFELWEGGRKGYGSVLEHVA